MGSEAGMAGGEKVVIVEKWWKSLRESLWESCGKVLRRLWEKWFCTYFGVEVRVFRWAVGKFCRVIYTWYNRGKSGVLHNFHSPYYYYY